MKLKHLYKRTIEIGMDADPREKRYLEKTLKKHADRQKKLDGKDKRYADDERTWNPYGDSRILNGTGEEDVKRVMVGIDIEVGEVLLADRLRERGEKIDCIIIHHPEGRALADLDKVMPLQADVYAAAGVPVNQSENLLRPRMDRIWRVIHADNFLRTERTAQLLGIPMFTCHTVTDNLVWRFMEKHFVQKKWDDLGEIVNALHDVEEYDHYAKKGSPAIIVNGGSSARPGKVVATEFTGGTNGPEELIEAQAAAGVGTILAMHFTEKEVELGKKNNLNLIQCNHMAADSLGMNLLLDKIKKEEKKLDVLPVSGFVRVER
jgi:putative NIF3 family GTP cyclohydrolase 1 type 2